MKSIKNCPTSTAILLFAQSKSTESHSKPIAYCKSKSILLWKSMNERDLKTIQSTNLTHFISDENSQIGDTFDEKITHAIQDIFNKGFEKVIVIGNDCLELKSNHLLKAAHSLRTNDFVLGAILTVGSI